MTVDEGALEEDQNIDLNLHGFDQAQQHAPNHGMSPARTSVISGTTIKTSFSMEEVEELDSDVMLDSLKSFNDATEALLEILVPTQAEDLGAVWEEIATEGTKAYKLYQKRLSAFLLYKSDYTTTQDYVRPHNVSRALFDVRSVDEIPPGTPTPDSVLYKANLAYLLHLLLIKFDGPGISAAESTEILEGADQAFPTVVAGPFYDPMALNISLQITRQLAINRMASFVEDPQYNPQGLATHAFFSEDDEENKQVYRHGHALHLDSVSDQESRAALDRIYSVVNALKEPYGDDTSEIDPVEAAKGLRETFPWRAFVEDTLVQYFAHRKFQLDSEMQAAHGMNNLDVQIKHAVANKEDLKALGSLTVKVAQSSGKSKMSAPPDEIRRLKAFAQAANTPTVATARMAPVAQMTTSSTSIHHQDDYPQSAEHDEPATVPSRSSIHDLSEFQNLQAAQKQKAGSKGKGRSFNDRQAGARRVEWDEDPQSQYTGSPQTQSGLGKRSRAGEQLRSSPAKRSRVHEEDWEPTQDGGPDDEPAFETKASDDAAADERRRQAPSAHQSAPSELRQPYYTRPASEDDAQGFQQSSPQRRNPGAAIPGPADPPSTTSEYPYSQQYEQAARLAKQQRVRHHAPVARSRHAWSPEETNALMKYIQEWPEEDSLHYASIKRMDSSADGYKAFNSPTERTAEDIRFRARNMKVNMLL